MSLLTRSEQLLIPVADQNPDVDLFAGMKKKKKKQVALEPEETPSALPAVADSVPEPAPAVAPSAPAPEPEVAAPVAAPADDSVPADGEDMFADLKKKKKKKKEIPMDLDVAEGSTAPAAVPEGMDGMKKKKSKKQASDFAKELDEMDAENEDADGDVDGDDLFEDEGANGDTVESGKEAWVLEGRDPTYPELLKRFFTLLHQHNPELAGEKRRYQIVPPQVAREGTKKTVFANVTDICRRMHRPPEHVISYLYSELGTQGTIDGAQRLVMKGRYTQKQMETVLRRYISEYVTCKICKSPDTLLSKDNRLYFMTCEVCGSRLSVSAIKAGYQAQGKRIKPVG